MTKQFDTISSEAMNDVAGGYDAGQTVIEAANNGLFTGAVGAAANFAFPAGRSRLRAAGRAFAPWALVGAGVGAAFDIYRQATKK